MNKLQGIGSTSLYGFTPAINLIDKTPQGPVNILLANTSDIRHVYPTIAANPQSEINFYIIEPQSTVNCRNLLLFNLFVTEDEISVQEQVEMFLDLYNNTSISERTFDYIISASKSLIKTITDSKGILHDMISLSYLKYRERDDLEFVLKFYLSKPFEVSTLWDTRLRTLLRSRYDSRDNVFDWDYNMKLLDSDPRKKYIHKKQYCKWRNTGSWYLLRSNQTKVNKTMATVDIMKIDGVGVAKYGVFSDIVLGPFQCFGIETENQKLLKLENDRPTQTVQEIMEWNIRDWICKTRGISVVGKLFLNVEPEEKIVEEKSGEMNDEKIVEITGEMEANKIAENEIGPENGTVDQPESIPLEDNSIALQNQEQGTTQYNKPPVKLHLLPCDPAATFNKPKTLKFDVIYLGSSIAHRLQDVNKIKKGDSKVYVELIDGVFEIGKEERKMYKDKIIDIGKAQGLNIVKETKDYLLFQ
ncbi:Dynein assembly factor 3, axonemal [Boothiomyces macroporosus]|uniref:Dynein assembly factor 3, axonemal n=1 Tax=Boothiomyces macroporosus TaxID=261099 RepID=A0AAD5UDY1_9FUNG|nr:Dynein assembly factor 3, axonemal [Boothiomyces macroporosus]